MAMTLADAVVRITGDDSPLKPTFDSVKSRTNGLVSSVGSKIATLGTAAVIGGVVAAGAAIAGIGVAAFSAAMDVDTATAQLQTRLGLTEERAAELGDVITQVYGNNFGQSIDDVGQAVGTVSEQMDRFGQMTAQELQTATETALALRDAFGTDVAESTNAANTLMENFGLTADEAFTFIQAGMERGLNASGDFLETIGEYSNQFADGGADAGQFFSILDTGLAGGIHGTDRAADLFKEFRLRIQDGSDSTAEALNNLGLDADAMAAAFADGSLTAADAFSMVQGAMAETEDQNLAFQSGVALMGSQFEDLGESAAAGLDPMALSMEDIAEGVGDLGAQYDTIPQRVEGMKRRVTAALIPVGEALLPVGESIVGLVERATPYLELFAVWLADKIPLAIAFFRQLWERVAPRVESLIGRIASFWNEHGQGIIDKAMEVRDLVLLYVGGVWENIRGLFNAFKAAFSGDWEGFGASIGNILVNSIETAIQLLSGLWALVQPLLATLWTSIWTWFTTTDWKQFGLDVINAIADAISGFWGVVQPWLADLWTNFSTWFTTTDWAQVGYDVVTAIMEALDTLWSEWLPALGQLFIDVGNWFGEQDWAGMASDVIDGIVRGITNGASAVAGALTDLASGMWAAWQDWWNNRSPSRRMVESGEDITAGAEIGLQNFQDRVIRQLGVDQIGERLSSLTRMVTPNLNLAGAMAGAGGQFVSQDQFYMPVTNPRDAQLAAHLIEQSRRQKLQEHMNRG